MLFEYWIVVVWKISLINVIVWVYKLSNSRKIFFFIIDSVIFFYLNYFELVKIGYSLYLIWLLNVYLNYVFGIFCLNRNGLVIFINSFSSENN